MNSNPRFDGRFIGKLMLVWAALLLLPGSVDAGSSGWIQGDHNQVRMVSGDSTGPIWTAAVEIRLDDKWKTYWRNPGDAGIPPRFDFTKSQNLSAASVHYPAPIRFRDSYGESIGYKGKVAFPVDVTPIDASKPVTVSLSLDYAVCDDICIPAQANVSIVLKPGLPDLLGVADTAKTALPKMDSENRVGARIADSDTVDLWFDAPTGTSEADIFVEPPKGWYLAMPKPVEGAGEGPFRFILSLKGMPKTADPEGAQLRITAVSDKGSFEKAVLLER